MKDYKYAEIIKKDEFDDLENEEITIRVVGKIELSNCSIFSF